MCYGDGRKQQQKSSKLSVCLFFQFLLDLICITQRVETLKRLLFSHLNLACQSFVLPKHKFISADVRMNALNFFKQISFSRSVLFRPCQHPRHEEHHGHCWTGCFCPLPCHWLPLLLHKVVQKLRTTTLQSQAASIREQRHAETDQRAAGRCWRVHLQGDGPAQQDGLPERPRPCQR